MRWRLPISVVLAVTAAGGCIAEGPHVPLPSQVTVQIDNPEKVRFVVPLRYAVVWTTYSGMAVTADGPVASLDGRLIVPLQLPSEKVLNALNPIEGLAVLGVQENFAVFRPRIVVYADVDGNGRFEPPSFGIGGPDRVLAIDSGDTASVAAFLDLDRALKKFTLEETNTYYESTHNLYTAFVRATFSGGLRLDATATPPPVKLHVRNSAVPQEQLACLRQGVALYGDGLVSTLRVSVVVGQPLDPALICSANLPDCRTSDLDTLAPPQVATIMNGDTLRVAQCRQGNNLAALVVQHAQRDCAHCVCAMEAAAVAYVADPAALPSWWPCGTTVDVCDSQLPLIVLDPECLESPPDSDTVSR